MITYQKPATIIPVNDPERLRKLHGLGVLDTPPEEAFDKIARLAAQIFDTPSAFVTFVDKDRVFFKSNLSPLEGNQVKREDSLCSLAILGEEVTVFDDTHQVPDLRESPHVSCQGGIRFYAGAPLKTREGYRLGTVCVVDSVPRQASLKQLQMLETLSSIVVDELEQRLAAQRAISVQTDLVNMAVHDLKNPALNIASLSDLLLKRISDGAKVQELVGLIKGCSEEISGKLDGLLKLSRLEDESFQLQLEEIDLPALLDGVSSNFGLMAAQKGQCISYQAGESIAVRADRARLQEVFENLISNAIKYSHSDTTITIAVSRSGKQAVVSFQDQGQGLSEGDMQKLFTKFARLSSIPTGRERSNGLGLSIVKTLVELQGGKVWATSDGKNKGATFFVSIPLYYEE
jgi:signal transduction histidine kinase